MNFREWKLLYFDSKFTEFLFLRVQIDNTLALDQVMAWHRTGGKPLHEPMLTQFDAACSVYAALGGWDQGEPMRGKKAILWNACGVSILGSNMLLICLQFLLNYNSPLHIGRCHELCTYHLSIPFENQKNYNSLMCWINVTDTVWEYKTTNFNIQ